MSFGAHGGWGPWFIEPPEVEPPDFVNMHDARRAAQSW